MPKEEFATVLKDVIQEKMDENRDRIWEKANEHFEALIREASSIISAFTKGAIDLRVIQRNTTQIKDCNRWDLLLWNCAENKELLLLDVYHIKKDGQYPMFDSRVTIGDVQGFRQLFLAKFADPRDRPIELLRQIHDQVKG